MDLLPVLRSLRSRPVLRTRVLQRSGVALGAADTLSLRSVPLPCLARLCMVHLLGDVRRSIQITVMCDTASGATWVGVVTHVQIGLTDMALPGRVRCVNLEDSSAVGVNHVPGAPVYLATEPALSLIHI